MRAADSSVIIVVHLMTSSSMCGPCRGTSSNEFAVPQLRLVYFPFPGRAGPIRRVLRYGKIPFEDEHVTLKDWASIKPKMVTGKVPVLFVGDEQLPESIAILNYAGRLAGLVPTDPLMEAKMQSVVMAIQSLGETTITPYYLAPPEKKESVAADLADKALPEGLAILERLIKAMGNNSGYCVGNELTVADFYFQGFVEAFGLGGEMFKVPFDIEEHMKKYHTHLHTIYQNMKRLTKDSGL